MLTLTEAAAQLGGLTRLQRFRVQDSQRQTPRPQGRPRLDKSSEREVARYAKENRQSK